MRTIRIRKATLLLALMWLFAEGIACGLWVSFRESEREFERVRESLEMTAEREPGE